MTRYTVVATAGSSPMCLPYPAARVRDSPDGLKACSIPYSTAAAGASPSRSTHQTFSSSIVRTCTPHSDQYVALTIVSFVSFIGHTEQGCHKLLLRERGLFIGRNQ